MTTKERIRSKMLKKGWVVTDCHFEAISYNGPNGREGGWFVDFKLSDKNKDVDGLIEMQNIKLIGAVKVPRDLYCIVTYGILCAYNKEDVFKAIDLLPVAVQ